MSNKNDYDLAIDEHGDIMRKNDWDLETVEGAGLVAQDVRRTLEFPIGALSWSPKTGSQIGHAINAPADPALLERELVRVARADDRIDQSSIRIDYAADGTPILRFHVQGDIQTQEVHIT